MGLHIDRDTFLAGEYEVFRDRLVESLVALRDLVADPAFGAGITTIGAELEVSLVDDVHHRPLALNREVLAACDDPRLTLELNRYNLEMNLSPVEVTGAPFSRVAAEMREVLAQVRSAAAARGGRVVTVGILPTLTTRDLQLSAISDDPRYRALDAGLRRLRGQPFQLDIAGLDHLRAACEHVTLEGANTSFQLHLRVPPTDYEDVYNAVQWVTPAVLAISGNSPTFLQHRLWDETRIALFKQAVDDRGRPHRGRPARVSFGQAWLQGGVAALFAHAVHEHEPIIPVMSEQDPIAEVAAGRVPELLELRLHQSTVWRWNRPVYDPAGGGHVRIELRALPSGPTPADMIASAALAAGAALALAPRMPTITRSIPFADVDAAFYRAARFGLGADLPWVRDGVAGSLPATHVLAELLPLASRALVERGVDEREVDAVLWPIADRLATGRTGAVWQRRALARLAPSPDPYGGLVREYADRSESGRPVHTWDGVG